MAPRALVVAGAITPSAPRGLAVRTHVSHPAVSAAAKSVMFNATWQRFSLNHQLESWIAMHVSTCTRGHGSAIRSCHEQHRKVVTMPQMSDLNSIGALQYECNITSLRDGRHMIDAMQ